MYLLPQIASLNVFFYKPLVKEQFSRTIFPGQTLGVPLPMKAIVSHDQFKPIRIGYNLVVNNNLSYQY